VPKYLLTTAMRSGMAELFRITRLAPLTQFQDMGRYGHLSVGFSLSGAMDSTAFALNNELLGNASRATQLEIAPGGLELLALSDCVVAISGTYANPCLNGQPLVNFCCHRIVAGDVLSFGFSKLGLYSYLAVSGGFDVVPFLGSTATTRRIGIFPDRGKPLVKGSVLSGGRGLDIALRGIPRQMLPHYAGNVIEVVPAYQYEYFSRDVSRQFATVPFTVKMSDRMGTRLSCLTPLTYAGDELLSEGVMVGAVQIPPDGQPIVLQRDAQSIGGYPKIGVIPEKSRSLLAQMAVGRTLRFTWLDLGLDVELNSY